VLIALDSLPDGQTPLRAGMTVTARVDTGHVRSLSALR
jgi:multidrug resistance efflux pump